MASKNPISHYKADGPPVVALLPAQAQEKAIRQAKHAMYYKPNTMATCFDLAPITFMVIMYSPLAAKHRL